MSRLFVGLELPASVKETLLRVEAGIPGAHWQTENQLHLTLRFIGDVDGPTLGDVASALDLIEAPALELAIRGVGIFGNLKRTRALWAGVADNPALFHLQDKVESALVRMGLKPEPRKFHPHVTLARFGNPERHRLQDFLQVHDALAVPPFPVEHFTLFSSMATQKGSIYTVEETYPLDESGQAFTAERPGPTE